MLDSAKMKLRPVSDSRWLKPWLLCENTAADGGSRRDRPRHRAVSQ